jgi:deoxycytidine triphosphate deaminase
MSFLTGIEIRKQIDANVIFVKSLDNAFPFLPKEQVTEDSIDLRLFPTALRIKYGTKQIDFLHDDLKEHYEEVTISPTDGYLIRPGEILFGQTLEVITFPDKYVGLVFSRATFAQMGIMVTCGSPKFAVGISWAFPLQLTNCGNVPVKVYPYTVVAQLMISEMSGTGVGYPVSGRFYQQYLPTAPEINNRDKTFLKEMTKESEQRIKHIEDKIADVKKLAEEQKDQEIIRENQRLRNKPKIKRWIYVIKTSLGLAAGGFIALAVNLFTNANAAGQVIDTNTRMLIIFAIVLGLISGGFAVYINPNINDDERN